MNNKVGHYKVGHLVEQMERYYQFRKLNYSKNSWTEVKATLERLKTWAVAEENRYDQKSVCRAICRAL